MVLAAAAAALSAPIFVAIVSAIWLVSGLLYQDPQPSSGESKFYQHNEF